MNFQVLARKWRPKTFSDVVGQKHILAALTNSLSIGRIHHAYLFSGTRGVGKTSIARLLAKGLNCKIGITALPCSICDNCREIEQGRFFDLIEIDAASRTKVEDIREILSNMQCMPVRGRFKVYLIDEVHMLSRYSFNALLKTLEEPPLHVKFLLATTDPQKLPITVLSRCLQFHLKILDVDQIHRQLEHVLNKEKIEYIPHAIQLLARMADGSLRDALNLADQAIAIGNGKLSSEAVNVMFHASNEEQSLLLIEAIIAADGERMIKLINEIASRGVEWETLLISMQGLLHRIAMIQLSSSPFSTEITKVEHRIRELARTVPPTDIQLYYQTLLIGRKELPYAPDKRMGIEMTLLRALAFHPRTTILTKSPKMPQHTFVPVASKASMVPSQALSRQSVLLSNPEKNTLLPDVANQLLATRKELKNEKKSPKSNKSKSVTLDETKLTNNFEHKHSISAKEYIQSQSMLSPFQMGAIAKTERSLREATNITQKTEKKISSSKMIEKTFEYDKIPREIEEKLAYEAAKHDTWTATVNKLKLPKLARLVALNAWKEQEGNQICLHLRPEKHYLNSPDIQRILEEALTELQDEPIELTIIEDNDLAMRTPTEWQQTIYEEKLERAKKMILSDSNIQKLRDFFDAELDEKSIFPVLS